MTTIKFANYGGGGYSVSHHPSQKNLWLTNSTARFIEKQLGKVRGDFLIRVNTESFQDSVQLWLCRTMTDCTYVYYGPEGARISLCRAELRRLFGDDAPASLHYRIDRA